jgi:hypothetical protein
LLFEVSSDKGNQGMKQRNNASPALAGGAGSNNPARPTDAKNRPVCRENFVREPVKGIPGPDLDVWERWFAENLNKDTELGQIARDHFTMLFDDCVVRLFQIGLHHAESSPKQWAGKVLARLHVSLVKHHGKLGKANPAYQEMEKKLRRIRADVLLPSSPVGVILQQELRTTKSHYSQLQFILELSNRQPQPWLGGVNTEAVFERIRDQLVLQHFAGVIRTKLKGNALESRYGALWTEQGLATIEKAARKTTPPFFYADEITRKRRSTWENMAREWKIPEEYWPLKDFPPLSKTTEKKWWNFIWGRLNKKHARILPHLRDSKKGRGKYLSDFQRQFRKHWNTLVDLLWCGLF